MLVFNEERKIPGRQKVVRGSSAPVLTSHIIKKERNQEIESESFEDDDLDDFKIG